LLGLFIEDLFIPLESGRAFPLIDKIDINQLEMKQKIEEEISRYQKFTTGVLGSEAKIPKVDVRKYAKYILREGTKEEKREMIWCLKVMLRVEDGKVEITD